MSSEAQTAFEQGKLLLVDKKMTSEAITALAKAVGLEPNNSKYHSWYAQALNANSQYIEAIKEASLSIQLDPQNGKGFRQRGNAYKNLKKYSDSVDDYSKAIEIDSNDLFALSYRADAYWYLNKYDLAIQDNLRVIQLDPKDAWSYGRLGDIYTKLKNIELAISNYSQAIEINPAHSGFYSARSNLYWEMKDLSKYIYNRVKLFELSGIGKIPTNDTTEPERGYRELVNNHFHTTVYPIIKSNQEKIVDYWLAFSVVWDRRTEQSHASGTSFRMEYGWIGQGYISLTDQNLRIATFGNSPHQFKIGFGTKILRSLLPVSERLEPCKTDQLWTIPVTDIQSTPIVVDKVVGTESIKITISGQSWYLYTCNQEEITIALNLARSGKLSSEAIEKKPTANSDVIKLLKELAELKEQGVLTESEFESKKKELLSRL